MIALRSFLLILLLLVPLAARADDLSDFLASDKNHANAKWPGLYFQVILIQRLPPDRIVVGAELKAGPSAPPGGTFIGVDVPIPKWASAEMIRMGMFRPHPYSFRNSVLTDDLSQTTYPGLEPVRFGKQIFQGSSLLTQMRPFESRVIALQFGCPPPPPPPPPGQPPKKQTVSILFTNAVGPISKIPIPPPTLQYGSPGTLPH